MTDSNTLPNTRRDPDAKPAPARLSLSLTQVLASVLAAVSASIAASVFGVAGTVIGAALGSAISVVGGAIYAQSLERSRQAVRLTVGVAAARRLGGRDPIARRDPDSPDNPAGSGKPPGRRHRLRLALTPQRLALGAGALFVLTMGLITGFELLTGQPVAASVEGKQGSGVSVLGGTARSGQSSSPAPASSSPSSTAPASTALSSTAPSSSTPAGTGSTDQPTGTGQPTPTVTVTVTPSATPTASPSASPTPDGTGASSPVADGSTAPTGGG